MEEVASLEALVSFSHCENKYEHKNKVLKQKVTLNEEKWSLHH